MDQVFDISFHGQSGFTFEQVYNMPVNVRAYYYAKLAGILEERARLAEEANKKGKR